MNERLFVCGHEPPDTSQIELWIRYMLAQNRRIFGLIDFILEYGGGTVMEGTNIVSGLRTTLNDEPRNKIILYMRSGNDTVEDEQLYKAHGADGMISKCTAISDLINIL